MKMREEYRPLQILNSTINMVNIDAIVEWISGQIRRYRDDSDGGQKSPAAQMVVSGFHGINQASKDTEYFQLGQDCDLWVPDSIAPVLIARMRGMRNVSRTPGMDLMEAFFACSEKKGYRNFFYGDTPETLEKMRQNLQKRYPDLKIAGMLSPPFRTLSEAERQEHIAIINQAKPDVLWVGLGLPKQDIWIYHNKNELIVPVAAGVGAAFRFFAGTVTRAPLAWRKLGLEWLYMTLRTPKRTIKRVTLDGSEFIWKVLKEEYKRRTKG